VESPYILAVEGFQNLFRSKVRADTNEVWRSKRMVVAPAENEEDNNEGDTVLEQQQPGLVGEEHPLSPR
jgi:hypothetical protein